MILFSLGLLASGPEKMAYLESPESAGEIEAQIWYLGHSGWAIRTENHLLIFSYEGHGLRIKEPVQTLGGENRSLWVFVSHEHIDHFTPEIFEWEKAQWSICDVYLDIMVREAKSEES